MKKSVKLLCLIMAVALLAVCACSCKGGKTVASLDDLPGANIGVQQGTTGDIYASDYEKEGSTVSRYLKGADAVVALTTGKVDCVIIDNEPAKSFVEANKGLKILDEPFAEEDYAICVAKENTELLNAINGALKELKEEGVIDSIIKNYIGDDTIGKSPYVSPENVDTSKGELHMATNAHFPPYEYMEGDKVVGIDADIAQAICDKLGYKLVIDDMEFNAIIAAVKTGKADFGAAGMTVTDKRLEEINFTDTYATGVQVIIVKE